MGTQIQSETYFLRHCSRNLSRNISTGGWLPYQERKVPGNGQHEDSSSPWRGLMDRYSGKDKAKVKEAMLEHEVTFKHQVRELHRLYRRQRELMNAIQDNRLYKIQKKAESSHSLVFPSYMSSESTKRTCDKSHFLSSDSMLGQLDPSSSRSGQLLSTLLKRTNCEPFNPCGDMYLHKPVGPDISRGAFMNKEETVVGGRSFGLVGSVVGCGDRAKEVLQERASNSFPYNSVNYHSSPGDSESNVRSEGRNYSGCFNEPFQFLSNPSSVERSCHLSFHADKLERRHITANISTDFSLHKESSQYSMPVMNGQIFPSRSLSGCHGNGKELMSDGIKFSNDLSLHVEHRTESRKKRKIFGVEIAEEVDRSSMLSSDVNNLYPRSTGLESYTSHFLSGKAFTSHSSKKVGPPQGSHGAATSEPSWLKLGSCLHNLELAGGIDASGAIKSSVPKCELTYQSTLSVHPQLNPESIDGGAAASLDIWKGKNSFTSLPDLCEFHDSGNCRKKANVEELKAMKSLDLDSEITEEAEDKKDGNAIDLPTDVANKKCSTQIVANPDAPEKSLSRYISGLRNHIDLNLSIDEEEVPAASVLPAVIEKIIRPEIDLEVPALIESKVEHRRTKSPDKSEEPHRYLIEEAAEALVVISSAQSNDVSSYATSCHENTSNCLHWFADLVLSYTSDDGVIKESSQGIDLCSDKEVPDGMDYFEFMTLQLKDVKGTYCCIVTDMEQQKIEETEISVSKRRSGRGHGNRGRSRKDFQKDVLPDIVSLAKQEVVEDLQTLEELFHSTGKTWKSRLLQRNGAKSGRRRMKSSESLHTTEANSALLPSKPKETGRELQLRGKSFTGWGKKTRRLPRQRCSKKSYSSIQLLTSV